MEPKEGPTQTQLFSIMTVYDQCATPTLRMCAERICYRFCGIATARDESNRYIYHRFALRCDSFRRVAIQTQGHISFVALIGGRAHLSCVVVHADTERRCS